MVGLLFGILLPGTAGALTGAKLVVRENGKDSKQYGPIPANDPQVTFETFRPSVCANSPACLLVPLDIPISKATAARRDDFLVRVTVKWDAKVANGQQGNNLDVYVWDERTSPFGRSAGSNVPEVVTIFRPTKGTYNLTIVNRQGPNDGVMVSAEWSNEALPQPFESVEGSKPASRSESPGTAAPSVTPTSQAPEPQPLALAPVDQRGRLDDLAARSAALADASLGAEQAAPAVLRAPTPKPVPGWLAALWGGVVPLGALVGVWLWLRTRGTLDLN